MGAEGHDRVSRLARSSPARLLVEEYRRRGRTADAIEHTWAAFNSRPALETYRELAIDAKTLGEWDERRAAALTLLHAHQAKPDTRTRRPSPRSRSDATELVRVFLWEDDPDAAWQAATEGGTTHSLWLQLADQRSAEHPEDTLTRIPPPRRADDRRQGQAVIHRGPSG